MGIVTWRGARLDSRSRDMIAEVAKIVGNDIYVQPSQGGYNRGGVAASAGTHDAGGAVDVIVAKYSPAQRKRLVEAFRKVGWAAWIRTPYQSNWPWHLHAIAVQPGGKWDQGVLSRGAHSQVVDYYEGRNGLASRARDDATRAYVGTTWESYQRGRKEWDEMASKAEIKAAVREVVREELLGHNDPVKKTARTVQTMYERQKRMEQVLGRVDKSMGTAFARLRKMYRKIIEGPAGYDIGEKWKPTDPPVDPGYGK